MLTRPEKSEAELRPRPDAMRLRLRPITIVGNKFTQFSNKTILKNLRNNQNNIYAPEIITC